MGTATIVFGMDALSLAKLAIELLEGVWLYLAFKPVSSPFPQTFFRAENVKLIHTACFSRNRLSGYNFSANLASHVRQPAEEMF
jgi:hypothetical protein